VPARYTFGRGPEPEAYGVGSNDDLLTEPHRLQFSGDRVDLLADLLDIQAVGARVQLQPERLDLCLEPLDPLLDRLVRLLGECRTSESDRDRREHRGRETRPPHHAADLVPTATRRPRHTWGVRDAHHLTRKSWTSAGLGSRG